MTKKFNNLLQRESNDNVESYTWAGSVLGRQTETSNEFFLQDELGSVTRFMDKKGDILATYGYDEFGNDLSVDIPHYAKQGAYQPFGYTGYRMDTESGLYFAQAREYSSVHGQFVSEDIVRGYVESPITLNHYGYCWGNPEKYVDDDGLKIAAQWKDFLKADYIIGLVKRFGRENVASILNKIAGTIESNILCDIL